MVANPETPTPDYRAILLKLIASLTLCDHMVDVGNAMQTALDMAQIDIAEWDDEHELAKHLHAMGITTLHGISIGAESETDDEDE